MDKFPFLTDAEPFLTDAELLALQPVRTLTLLPAAVPRWVFTDAHDIPAGLIYL